MSEMSKGKFVRLTSVFLLISLVIVFLAAKISYAWVLSIPQVCWLVAGTVIGMLIGGFIFSLSDDTLTSILGVVITDICTGILVGPLLALYSNTAILQALILTLGAVGIMSVLGLLFPKFFEGIGPYIIAALVVLILTQITQIIFIWLGFQGAANLSILYWIGIGIFMLLVAHDWGKTINNERTTNEAVKTAGLLTLDFINILIRFLGGSDSKSD